MPSYLDRYCSTFREEKEMIDVTLASSIVAALVPFFKKAAEKGSEKLGESAAGALCQTLKDRLKSDTAKEAIAELRSNPDDGDAQGALRLQIKKAFEQQPELAAVLQELVAKIDVPSKVQTATAIGDDNKQTQIEGSNNSVMQ